MYIYYFIFDQPYYDVQQYTIEGENSIEKFIKNSLLLIKKRNGHHNQPNYILLKIMTSTTIHMSVGSFLYIFIV